MVTRSGRGGGIFRRQHKPEPLIDQKIGSRLVTFFQNRQRRLLLDFFWVLAPRPAGQVVASLDVGLCTAASRWRMSQPISSHSLLEYIKEG